MKYKRTIVVVLYDLHGGHKLGLLSPNTVLEDADEEGRIIQYNPKLSAPQQYLWKLYMSGIDSITTLAEKDDVVCICGGDITQGNKYISEQLTTRMSDQILIANANFEPLLKIKNMKAIRIAKGTAAHNFNEGSSEILLNDSLHKSYPTLDTAVLYHGLWNVRGVNIDYAHHGPTGGSREWLRGNEARYYLRSILYSELKFGNIPPDLVLRGHYHTYIREVVIMSDSTGEHESTIIIMPSMCMTGDYAIQSTKSAFVITNGIVAIEIINSKIYKVHQFMSTLDLRTKEAFGL
jgi:hypothetical protein